MSSQNGQSINYNVNANTAGAVAHLEAVKKAADDASGSSGHGAGGEGGMGIKGLLGAAAALAPALEPIAGVAAGMGAAWVGAYAQIGASVGLFAKVAMSDWQDLTNAMKAGTPMPAAMQKAADALTHFQTVWAAVKKDTSGPVFGVMTRGLNLAASLLPKIEPLITATAHGIQGAINPIAHFLGGSDVVNFLHMLTAQIGPELTSVGHTISNFGDGFINFVMKINPLTQVLLTSIQHISGSFASFTHGSGLNTFVDYVLKNMPDVTNTISALLATVKNLLRGMAADATPALHFIETLAQSLSQINFTPLFAGIGMIVKALTPVLPMLTQLINIILPPLGTVLTMITTDGIIPLVQSLGNELAPVLQSVGKFLVAFAKPFGVFLTTIANLVNPTGVGLLSKLLIDLLNAARPLIPAVFAILDALEGLVDNAFMAMRPLLPVINELLQTFSHTIIQILPTVLLLVNAFGTGMVGAIKALLPIITFLAQGLDTLLSIKWLVEAVLAIAAAFKAWTLAIMLFDAVADAGPLLLITAIGLAVLALVEGIKLLIEHWTAVTKFFANVGHDIANFFTGAATWLVHFGDQIIRGFLSGIHTAWDDVVQFFRGPFLTVVKDLFGWPVIEWLISKGTQIIRGLISGIRTAWNDVVNFFRGPFLTVLKDLYGWPVITWLIGHGANIIRGLFQGIRNIWSDVADWFRGLGNTIRGWFSNAINWLLGAGQALFRGFWQGIQNMWSSVASFLRSVGSQIVGFFGNAFNWLYTAGWNMMVGFYNGAVKFFGTMWNWLAGIPGNIYNFFNGLYNDMLTVGENIFIGLWNGMISIWNKIVSWLESAANSVSGFFKGILHILSPSRVMMGIGQNIMLGLHQGMKDTWDNTVTPFLAGAANSVPKMMQSMDLSNAVMANVSGVIGVNSRDTYVLANNVEKMSSAVGKMSEVLDKLPQSWGHTLQVQFVNPMNHQLGQMTQTIDRLPHVFQTEIDKQTKSINQNVNEHDHIIREAIIQAFRTAEQNQTNRLLTAIRRG